MARWGLFSAIVSLVAARGAGNSRRTAQDLADRLFPGQLTVIGSRSLFPQDSGSEVTFSVRDDPDAAVRLAVTTNNNEQGLRDEQGVGLVGADGLWSTLRTRLGDRKLPRFARRTAWRAIVPAARLTEEFREPLASLWLGRDAHLVHYPVKAGREVNIVAIVRDSWNEAGWNAPGKPGELAQRFAGFAPQARALILRKPDRFQQPQRRDGASIHRHQDSLIHLSLSQ